MSWWLACSLGPGSAMKPTGATSSWTCGVLPFGCWLHSSCTARKSSSPSEMQDSAMQETEEACIGGWGRGDTKTGHWFQRANSFTSLFMRDCRSYIFVCIAIYVYVPDLMLSFCFFHFSNFSYATMIGGKESCLGFFSNDYILLLNEELQVEFHIVFLFFC